MKYLLILLISLTFLACNNEVKIDELSIKRSLDSINYKGIRLGQNIGLYKEYCSDIFKRNDGITWQRIQTGDYLNSGKMVFKYIHLKSDSSDNIVSIMLHTDDIGTWRELMRTLSEKYGQPRETSEQVSVWEDANKEVRLSNRGNEYGYVIEDKHAVEAIEINQVHKDD